MRRITPKSGRVTTSINLDREFDVSEYPACKLFWPVNETSGDTLTDLVLGIGSVFPNGITFNGDGSIQKAIGGVITTTGIMPNLGNTKHPLAVFVGDLSAHNTSKIYIGSASSPEVGFGCVGSTFLVMSDATANIDILIDPDSLGTGVVYTDRTLDGVYMYEHDGTDIEELTGNPVTPITATTDLDFSLTNDSLSIEYSVSASRAKLFGAALFNFTDQVPLTEVQSILAWCNYNWRNGNKTLPPWLRGRV